MSEIRDAVYRFQYRGLSLLPVHYPMNGKCSCGSAHSDDPRPFAKHPATGNGSLDASNEIEVIESWWLDADWNIGVRTGAASGVLAIDVDGPEGVAEIEALEAEHGALPATYTTRSGRDDVSGHRLYVIPEGRVVRNAKLAPHIDVRGEGGYIILPPSLHRTGRRYEVIDGRWPVEAPAWVLDASEPVAAAPITDTPTDVDLEKLAGWVRRIFDEPTEDRSRQMFRLAAACVDGGLNDSDTLGVVAAHPPSREKYGNRLDTETRRVLSKLRAATPPHEPPPTGSDVRNAFAECVKTYEKWLHLNDSDQVVAALGAVAANVLPGDPFWILFVSAPGSGKTETIGPLAVLPYVHSAASFTEASLLSGVSKKEKAKGATGGLLRQIGDFGVFLCKDFSGVLSMHRDARAAALAALREIYDGSWDRPVGTDGGMVLSWKGKAGLVGAVTPSIDRHHSVMGALGERFVLYRISVNDSPAQGRRSIRNRRSETTMRTELGEAVAAVIACVDPDYDRNLEDAEIAQLVDFADYVTWARTSVERDGYSREVEVMPEREAPGRLAKQLATYLVALEAIGADHKTAWRVVAKVAMDCLPALRRQLLDYLYANGVKKSADCQEATGAPKSSVDRTLEDLALLKLVERLKGGVAENAAWTYRLSDDAEKLLRNVGVGA